jgi:predicted ArsR family transcriptional regulator
MQSFNPRTIEFAVKILPVLKRSGGMNCTEMAEVFGCSSEAVRIHVRRLTSRGVLERVHYRQWVAVPIRLEMEMLHDEET